MAGAVERGAWIVDIDPLQCGGEAVRVAFAALLAVGNDIEAGSFLVADGKRVRIVLRLFQKFGSHAPQLPSPHAWRKAAGKPLTVDQPIRLRVGTHQ